MSLQCGIVGITNVGKTTLFNCMSKTKAESSNYAFSSNKSNISIIEVPDERLDNIARLVNPAKTTHATVEIVDIPGLTKGASKGEGIGNTFLADIRNCDALIHVLRCFDDDNLPHIEGSVDPVRDLETVDFELQLKDIESIQKKKERLDKMVKTGDKDAKKGIEVMDKCREHLENLQSIRTLELDDAERKRIDDLFLLTIKPVMYVCNVDEASVLKGNAYVDRVVEAVGTGDTEVIIVAAALEAEISELEEEADRNEFLQDVGLTEPSMNVLIRSAYHLLDYISFFTTGPKEVKAWTIRRNSSAPQAAGAVHSDLERGFIRAEVIKYDDYIHYKTEHACKEAGKLHVEGKNYIVQDGDVVRVRFNV